MNEDNEEEEGMEQKFETSNTLVLTPGQARIAGAKQNEDIAMLLVMTAETQDSGNSDAE